MQGSTLSGLMCFLAAVVIFPWDISSPKLVWGGAEWGMRCPCTVGEYTHIDDEDCPTFNTEAEAKKKEKAEGQPEEQRERESNLTPS